MKELLLRVHCAVVKDTNDYEAPIGISFVKQRPSGEDDKPGQPREALAFDWLVLKGTDASYAHWVTIGADGHGIAALESSVIQESEEVTHIERCAVCQMEECACE